MKEIWEPVLEGRYEVSNKGRVKSHVGNTIDKNGMMKLQKDKAGYVYVPSLERWKLKDLQA